MTFAMPTVKQMPSANYSPTSIIIQKIFIHRTEGPTAEGAATWLCQRVSGASTHLISRGDGTLVYQLVPLQLKAWAQCAFNGQGVSIEYPGYTAQGVPDALAKQMGIEVAWLLRAYGLPCRHAAGGQGYGFCQHADLGAAGGSHHDTCEIGSDTWEKIGGCVRQAYDALGDAPLPFFAMHGLPNPHQVSLPPDVAPEPSHGGAPRGEPSDIAAHPTPSAYPHGSVADLQWRLNKAGASPFLAVDGHAGGLTRMELMRFQRTHGLTPDGLIGPRTWAALDAAT